MTPFPVLHHHFSMAVLLCLLRLHVMTHFLTHIILHASRIFWQRRCNHIVCLVVESALHVYKGQLSPWFGIHDSDITGIHNSGISGIHYGTSHTREICHLSFRHSTVTLSKRSTSRLGVSKTLKFGLNIMSSLRISLTFRFCQLQVKYKSSFISTFSEYAYESTGLWN